MHNPHEKPVLIVEDHPFVADATEKLLIQMDAQLSVMVCRCAKTARMQLQQRSWFRIFMDINIPGAHGMSFAQYLASAGWANQSVIVTAYDDPNWQSLARALGFLGYVIKATPIQTFVELISATLAGQRAFPDAMVCSDPFPQLTRRQVDMLDLLQRGYASKEIARQLGLSVGTVDNHISGLLKALRVTNRTHAIAKALELGYLDHWTIY
jgi:DNA-binding NarL/FixJ family response regulator